MTGNPIPPSDAGETVLPSQGVVLPTTVLVVDDAATERCWAGGLVVQSLGWQVVYAEDGRAALEAMGRETPDLVLTDLQMPEMNGLELVEAVRSRYPLVPVILMTAYGSEDIAVQALRKGAASYVPKKRLSSDLPDTLEQVLKLARADRQRQRLWQCLAQTDSRFVLENDPALVSALVVLLQENVMGMGLWDDTERVRVGVALEEALLNALYHGNLEVGSDLRQEEDRPYYRLAEHRRQQVPYRDRRIDLHATVSSGEAVYVVRDEGPGFDPSRLPDPTDPAYLERMSGRGLLLIRNFMDEVRFSDQGNQITMVKRRAKSRAGSPGPPPSPN